MTTKPIAADLDAIEALLKKSTPGPWRVWDSCSFRRITHEHDGDVISAYNQRSDNHPDLLAKREDLDLLCALRNAAPSLLASARREVRLEALLRDVEDLITMLAAHIKKGDMVDIANFAMMIWNREHPNG